MTEYIDPDLIGYDDRHARLAELAALEPGWLDDEAGAALSPTAVKTAARVLRIFALNRVTMPGIFPTEDGHVSFEWLTADNFRSWEFLPDGTIEHLDLRKER